MPMLSLEPATSDMSRLLRGIPDEILGWATPDPGYKLGDLIDHVGGIALEFAASAAKDIGPLTGPARVGDLAHLAADWRTGIPRDLAALAAAWEDESAWTGSTQAGGLDLPARVAAVVGLTELIVHGWDIAVASGQRLNPDQDALTAVHGFLAQVRFDDPAVAGGFGPVVAVSAERPLLDQVIGLSGRDPDWRPPPAGR
ncbi:MAG TPA: TIGR03086 family metal-binding protein [Streptosporangiaceae bacterium]|nr:TIGR03086 family metal-binding protein [Streptosporangiaceae bacterium]